MTMPSLQSAQLLRQLGTLARAGVPLEKGLASIQETLPRTMRKLATRVCADLEAGKPLAQSLREEQAPFSETQFACIEAAEVSGHIDSMLLGLAEEEERAYHLSQRLITRLIYPVFLLHAAAIIPSLIALIQDSAMDAALEVLLWLGPFYVAGFTGWFAYRIHLVDPWLLRLPLIGAYIRYNCAARFSRTLGAMLAAGIRVEEALAGAASACPNQHIRNRILESIPALESGEKITGILKQANVFPASYMGMLAAGEDSGALDTTLEQLAITADAQTSHCADRVGIIFPFLAYGLAVAIIVVRILDVLSPIFQTYRDLDLY